MNTSSDPTPGTHTIHVHIVDVIQQKEGGYTLIVQPHSDSDVTTEEIWRAALPGEYRGATRVDRLWHLYYAENPGYLAGTWVDITVPVEEGESASSMDSDPKS
jgi:hypothetical protein